MNSSPFILLTLIISLLYHSITKSQPNAAFHTDKQNICSGTTVNFINTSSGANAFEWFIDGMHYSYSEDTSAILYEGCYDLKEIKLVASDTLTGLRDTIPHAVEVFDTCFFHWTGTFLNCVGDTIRLGVNTKEISTHFLSLTPITVVSGCLTCPSIEFILMYAGTSVDRISTYHGGCKETTTYEYACPVSGVNNITEPEIEIFPNPVSDVLSINAKIRLPAELRIFDYSGRNLYSQKLFDEKSEIDFTVFPSGIFMLQIIPDQGFPVTRKLIKQE